MKLEIKNYNKIIKDKHILKNVNLSFESGNIYGFYGKNGSGKTMLFRAVSSLIYPTSGDILMDGKSIYDKDFDLSQLGILIETSGFYPYLSGFDNLKLLYSINHKRVDKELINEILEKVGLKEASKKKFKEYSLGMKQRLNIAQAIMEDPKIIILDEPMNGIDENGIDVVRNIIESEKNKNKIILLASHNKEDLNLLCDEIYHVKDGIFTKLKGDMYYEEIFK